MIAAEKGDLLRILREELAFLEAGGYSHPASAPWRPHYIFQDSTTCINYGDRARSRPCKECPPIGFVPDAQQECRVPCEHISLNENGETLDSLYRTASMKEAETAVGEWLRETIAKLEAEHLEEPVNVAAQTA